MYFLVPSSFHASVLAFFPVHFPHSSQREWSPHALKIQTPYSRTYMEMCDRSWLLISGEDFYHKRIQRKGVAAGGRCGVESFLGFFARDGKYYTMLLYGNFQTHWYVALILKWASKPADYSLLLNELSCFGFHNKALFWFSISWLLHLISPC